MKNSRGIIFATLVTSVLFVAQTCAKADQFTPPISLGSYYEVFGSGPTSWGKEPYLFGEVEPFGLGTQLSRDYFVIDLSQVPAGDVITSATFSIQGMFASNGVSGSISLFSTTLSPSLVLSATSQSDMETVYNGLAGGTGLASNNVTPDPAQPTSEADVTMTANSSFLALLNANIGGVIVVGDNAPGFNYGGPSMTMATSPVPEPGSTMLLGAAGTALICVAGRRKPK